MVSAEIFQFIIKPMLSPSKSEFSNLSVCVEDSARGSQRTKYLCLCWQIDQTSPPLLVELHPRIYDHPFPQFGIPYADRRSCPKRQILGNLLESSSEKQSRLWIANDDAQRCSWLQLVCRSMSNRVQMADTFQLINLNLSQSRLALLFN